MTESIRTVAHKQYADAGVVLLDGHVQVFHDIRQLTCSNILTVQVVPMMGVSIIRKALGVHRTYRMYRIVRAGITIQSNFKVVHFPILVTSC